MLRKHIRELLEQLGYSSAVPDEMLDQVIDQLLMFLDEGLVKNALTLKTGCVLHQITLANQEEVAEAFKSGLREGKLVSPKLTLRKSTLCLHLDEKGLCSITRNPCGLRNEIASCEVVRSSVEDPDLSEWK